MNDDPPRGVAAGPARTRAKNDFGRRGQGEALPVRRGGGTAGGGAPQRSAGGQNAFIRTFRGNRPAISMRRIYWGSCDTCRIATPKRSHLSTPGAQQAQSHHRAQWTRDLRDLGARCGSHDGSESTRPQFTTTYSLCQGSAPGADSAPPPSARPRRHIQLQPGLFLQISRLL
jgi:hypothetical protein